MKKLLSLVAAGLLLPAAALACEGAPACGSHAAANPSADTPFAAAPAQVADTTRVTIPVEGMSCGSCAARLSRVLQELEGVTSATVSFEKKQAVVVLEGKDASPERVVQTLTEMGFKAGTPVKG
jgi:copper chaperone CopZ